MPRGKNLVASVVKTHHASLRKQLIHLTDGVVSDPTNLTTSELLRFLKGDLIPHAKGEERSLYPAADPIIKSHGSATYTMTLDHARIVSLIHSIERTQRIRRGAKGKMKGDLGVKLGRLSLMLQGIVLLHLDKEEIAYLPLLSEHLSEGQQEELLRRMHGE